MDKSNFLENLISTFEENRIRFCVIGGEGVNAYVEPLVSLDLDLVIAAEQIEAVRHILSSEFGRVDSALRVQIQTDPRYFDFINRARRREVLGKELPVAAIEDILRGKIWAASDPQRRPSKRRKDLLDIERILGARPDLRQQGPPEILARLET